jgi:2-polyprenyl-6-methoxyphenol hydroxylase-like FAD-dependent oxidoreductase
MESNQTSSGKPNSPDVAVIGAGPVGCVTALAFARKGARVLLLEGNPRSAQRLAGECLHPPGVQVLEQLGLANLVRQGYPARGFAVFPRDESAPIFLEYPKGSGGLTCDHFVLVSTLRQAAATHPNIQLVPGGMATAIEGQHLYYETQDRRPQCVFTGLLVGADGRSSLARKFLRLNDQRNTISSMAGVLLEDVDLLHAGFGQVMLGGPGPVLACRIGPRHVRLFLDVPGTRFKKDAATLWELFHSVLLEGWRDSFRTALAERPVTWATNQWRSRSNYGRPGLALVGDAVGHYHPLTAVGLTLGFLDGMCLADSSSFADFRSKRSRRARVAELLAFSLYRVFSEEEPGAVALRQAIFQIWRQSPAECDRTMRLLAADDTDLVHFNRAFLRVLAQAGQKVLQESLFSGHWLQTARVLGSLSQWLRWLATGMTASDERASAGARSAAPET